MHQRKRVRYTRSLRMFARDCVSSSLPAWSGSTLKPTLGKRRSESTLLKRPLLSLSAIRQPVSPFGIREFRELRVRGKVKGVAHWYRREHCRRKALSLRCLKGHLSRATSLFRHTSSVLFPRAHFYPSALFCLENVTS